MNSTAVARSRPDWNSQADDIRAAEEKGKPVDVDADRDADHRNEPHPARQRLLWHLHLPARGDRGLWGDLSGLVLSSYFAGFTLGALRCERIIERVGHIRAYAAFVAGLVVAATTVMPLLPGPLPWLILRAFVGLGCAGLFIATESWLNAKAAPTQRGRIFSAYMFGTFAALAMGQLLIGGAKIETAGPFNAIAAPVRRGAGRRDHGSSRTAPQNHLSRSAFRPALPCGAHRGGRLRGGWARERRLLRARSGVDAGRRHSTRDNRDLHVGSGAGGPRIPSSGRPFRSLRPTDRARRAQPWLCGRRDRSGQLAALPISRLPGRSAARRLHVDLVPGLRRQRARPYARRSGCSGERAAHSGQRARLHHRPADRHKRDGAFQYRRFVLLHGRRSAPGSGRRRLSR